MGGRPLFALNIVGWPLKTLGAEMLGQVLAGGAATCDAAGISIVGGHTVDDAEPKYGLSVTGIVDPGRILRNVGARPGDALFLTKPLGSGILTTVLKKKGLSGPSYDRLVETMATLNRAGAEAMIACGARAATDVTGFGLLGHLVGMLRGGDVGVDVSFLALPLLPGVLDAAREGLVPGGSRKNLAYFGKHVAFDASVGEAERLVTADAQTSGGILAAIPPERASEFESKARAAGTLAVARIGTFTGDTGRIRVSA